MLICNYAYFPIFTFHSELIFNFLIEISKYLMYMVHFVKGNNFCDFCFFQRETIFVILFASLDDKAPPKRALLLKNLLQWSRFFV